MPSEVFLYMEKHTVLINTKDEVIYWTYLLPLICFCVGKQIIVLHLKENPEDFPWMKKLGKKFIIVAESDTEKNKIFNS